MIKTTTLREAVAEVFGYELKKVPEFTSSKPLQQVREWLDREGKKYKYEKGRAGNGVVVYSVGAGNPQYAIVEDNFDVMGAQILAVLSPKSKSQERREKAMNEDKSEETPKVENAAEDQSEPQTTVPEPKKPRKTTRKE